MEVAGSASNKVERAIRILDLVEEEICSQYRHHVHVIDRARPEFPLLPTVGKRRPNPLNLPIGCFLHDIGNVIDAGGKGALFDSKGGLDFTKLHEAIHCLTIGLMSFDVLPEPLRTSMNSIREKIGIALISVLSISEELGSCSEWNELTMTEALHQRKNLDYIETGISSNGFDLREISISVGSTDGRWWLEF